MVLSLKFLFFDFKGNSKFETIRNTGMYQITLDIKIEVSNSSKSVINDISSSMNWEKNIFFLIVIYRVVRLNLDKKRLKI